MAAWSGTNARAPGRASAPASAGTTAPVDDRIAQFLVSVGKLCADARLGGLIVGVRLVDGTELLGVPEPPDEIEGAGQLDDTGFADALRVDGVTVPLSDVAEASIHRPSA
jgi:hypothetical protein